MDIIINMSYFINMLQIQKDIYMNRFYRFFKYIIFNHILAYKLDYYQYSINNNYLGMMDPQHIDYDFIIYKEYIHICKFNKNKHLNKSDMDLNIQYIVSINGFNKYLMGMNQDNFLNIITYQICRQYISQF